jgi:hypothetical protein
VAVAKVDLERREIDFRLVDREAQGQSKSTKPTKGTKKGQKKARQATSKRARRR